MRFYVFGYKITTFFSNTQAFAEKKFVYACIYHFFFVILQPI